MSTDRNEALRLADELDYKWQRGLTPSDIEIRHATALLIEQAERIAELEKLVEGRRIETNRVIAIADSATAERDQLRAEVERYHHLRNGQSWPAVFASHDAPEPLRGDELDAAIDQARTTHKDEG